MTRSGKARWLRWLAPALVLGVAAVLRFWALDRPGTLVFDELYYVRDAISQLAHGFPTTWPDSDPDMTGSRATAFTDEAAYAVHPPLGKWLIGLGILTFGPGNGWGWRSAVALAGVLTVAVVMRLGWRLTRSLAVACVAGLLLALDGVHIVLTRVGLLDGVLTLFVALGALFVWRDQQTVSEAYLRDRIPLLWRRPWLFAAALSFGAAASVKWSGLYPLAFFLIFVTVRDLTVRVRARGEFGLPGPIARSALQGFITAAIALPVTVLVYLVSWTGWIITAGGWGRDASDSWFAALLSYHAKMFEWHGTLSAPHPYRSSPIGWPIAWKPTAMYKNRDLANCPWDECLSGISPLPNPFVTWAGVIALLVLLWWALRAKPGLAFVSAFLLTGFASGWLPWVLTFSRSAVFQFYAVVLTPFSALALALVIGVLCRAPLRTAFCAATAHPPRSGADISPVPLPAVDPVSLRGRLIATALFLAVCALAAIFFFPVWSGMPVPEWFWRLHLWLPAWA